jgi:hypothetical protein
MPDIYNRTGTEVAGAFSADGAQVVLSGISASEPIVAVSLGLNYNQQITRLYSLLKAGTYYVAGRTRGNVNFGDVVGPAAVSAEFFNKYGNACQASQNALGINLSSGCGTSRGAALNFTVKGVVIENVGWTMSSQDMVINERIDAMFSGLDRN